jgi:hypothetical protein
MSDDAAWWLKAARWRVLIVAVDPWFGGDVDFVCAEVRQEDRASLY